MHGEATMRIRSAWSRIGLLLVLLFLGHDLFMALESSAAPQPHIALVHHASPLQLPATHDAAPHDDASQPEHPAGCDVVRPAAPRAADEADRLDPSPAAFSGAADSAVSLLRATTALGWEVPCWPPAAFRALIQVYRM